MNLSESELATVQAVLADKSEDFVRLVAIAGLDPSRDFRYANLRGINFGAADLRPYDFTGADLEGSDLSKATCHAALFLKANLAGAKLPVGLAESLSPSQMRPALRPYEREAVKRICDHLAQGHSRVAAELAAESGRLAILGGILDRLLAEGGVKRCLIVTSDAIDRDQIVTRFGKRRATSLGISISRVGDDPKSNIVVGYPTEIIDAYKEDAHPPNKFSHVVFIDIDNTSHDFEGIYQKYVNSTFLAFSSIPIKSLARRQASGAAKVFGPNVAYSLSLTAAIREGVGGAFVYSDVSQLEPSGVSWSTPQKHTGAMRHLGRSLREDADWKLVLVLCDTPQERDALRAIFKREVPKDLKDTLGTNEYIWQNFINRPREGVQFVVASDAKPDLLIAADRIVLFGQTLPAIFSSFGAKTAGRLATRRPIAIIDYSGVLSPTNDSQAESAKARYRL